MRRGRSSRTAISCWQSPGMRAALRRAIEKADRFWFAPWRAKTQARCGGDAVRARRFLAGSRRGCERHSDGRLKKRTGRGCDAGERKPKPDAAGTQFAHGDFLLAVAGDASGIKTGD